MGAVGGEELKQWEKMEGMAEVAGGGGGGMSEKIFVSVRLRPLNENEIARNDQSDWECINETTIIFRNSLPERSMFPTAHTFDRVFRCECTTRQVYDEGAKEVALSVVSGINSSIFAYGQTSSGKTYTMTGITEYAVADIYDYIYRHEERAFVLKFSAMEIYNEAVKDLLSTDSTPLRLLDDPEKGTIVEKLTEEILRDRNHLMELITVCQAQRKIGETSLNETSSRSHQILRLTIESSAREFLGKDNSSSLVASVNFVDLAGSERASQALSTGARLKEGCHINRSLLTLGTVIRKLSKGRNGHIPYRDSKLTRILQPSLGGNARTAIICTMSPARSHVEQSRNTLLFANCAKEVVTSAQVNVVMSDKALVRHLQKELARLENELRYPPASASGLEALLREKEAHIRKMEKEIKELIRERDLAQSRLEDLLQVVEEDRASRHWDETSQTSTFQVPNACEDVLSTSESSVVSYHGVDFGLTKLSGSQNSHYLQLSDKQRNQDVLPTHSIGSSMLAGLIHHQSEEAIVQNPSGNLEDLCKEVRCIEMNGPRRSVDSSSSLTEGSQSLLTMVVDSPKHGDQEPKPNEQMNSRPLGASPSFITLEQHLQNFKKTLNNLDRTYPDESSPWSSVRDSSRGWVLGRSRSCKSALMSSSWFHELERNDKTPPSSFSKEFPGRSEGFQRRRVALNYGEEAEMLGKQESQAASALSISGSTPDAQISKTTASDEDIVGISDFVAGLKEMAQTQYQKQLTDQDANGDITKNESLDSILNPVQSPSRWPLEFEKKQLEIIELWHACNVSLVHRTYFFLLFKGDPADSIYIEVELRRLSFLTNAFSQQNVDTTLTAHGQNDTLAASIRTLRREREMLCKKMQKRLSAAERESLYTKWGIQRASKQRRVQLSRRLWSNTKDLEHVRESALLVARLIGLLEPGKALKEMFGLSFTPQHSHRRSYNWRHGMSSLK